MQLSVPLVQQRKNSSECGVACIAMLLKYYDIEVEYEKLCKEIGVLRWGTSMPQLGLWLLKHGFEVEIVTIHPALFNLYSRFVTKEKLLQHFKSFRGKVKPKMNEVVLEHFIEFVKAGGKVTPRVPGLDDLKTELAAKRPPICLITHWFLYDSGMEPAFTFHFNVITGMDRTQVFVNDPDWGKKLGGSRKHRMTEYLYAMYASAYGAIDNASIMKIKRRV